MTTAKPSQADEVIEKTFDYLDKVLNENSGKEKEEDLKKDEKKQEAEKKVIPL